MKTSFDPQSWYDSAAVQFAASAQQITPGPLEQEFVAAAHRIGAPCVDLGCGSGLDLAFLRGSGLPVFGLDISHQMLLTSGLSGLIQASFDHLPFAVESLGGFFARAAFVHLGHSELLKLFHTLRSLALPGAPFLLSLKASADLDEGGFDSAGRHFTLTEPDVLRSLLSSAGWEVSLSDLQPDTRRPDTFWSAALAFPV